MADASKMFDGVMGTIYNKINDLFGSGDMLFSMEFPARPLNRHKFEYSTKERNSVLTKPYTITESEFRLSDDLFNIAPITQGPNGKKLSTVFDTIINNYVPKLSDLKDFVVDKTKIREWLQTIIEDEIDGQPVKCSRMEFCQRLYNKYLEEKNKWQKEKDQRYDQVKYTQGGLDEFAKWVASEGLIRDQKLDNLFSDAVVRGNYHEVLTYLGFLNVSSTAEQLEKTKQNMRNSARKSLDASMMVYPVQFQPNNWFKSLTPNFSPKDLTMSRDVLVMQFENKQREISKLKAQLANLQLRSTDPEEIERLKEEVEAKRQKFREAENNLIKQYGQGVVTAFKVYLNAQTGGALSAIKAIKAADFDKTTADALGLAEDVVKSMLDTYKANSEFLDSAQDYTEIMTEHASAVTHDFRAQENRLKERISELQRDIDYIGGLVSGVYNKANELPADKDADILPQSKEEGDADLDYADFVIKTSDAEDFNSQTDSASSSQSSWKVSAWIFSAGGQSSSSSSMSEEETKAMSKDFEIGFRASKVTFDRGGWFNPTLFDMSHAFYRLSDLKAGAGLNKEDIKNKTIEEIEQKILYNSSEGDNKPKPYLLPAFPVAFVVAKDITVRIKMTESESKDMKSYMEKSRSSGGGFLCFSCSSSSSSKNSNETSFHGSHNGYFYIRIPGPQIIGWFLNFLPQDNAKMYEPLDDDLVKLALEKELDKGIKSPIADEVG